MTPFDNTTPPQSPAQPDFQSFWSRELESDPGDIAWLWDSYLAPGKVTLLTSQWKSGKTTLVSVLLSRRAAGGNLAGRALRPGRTAVVCEEDRDHWAQRRRRLDFGDGVAFFCHPIECRKPTADEWLRLIDSVARLADDGVDLAVIDPLASFLPGDENNNDSMMDRLMALGRLRSLGMAVLILHHPKKGLTVDGQAARGAGSLPSYVDINIEMRYFRSADDGDRRRVLRSWSRFPATPPQLVIEWTTDGGDYLARGMAADEDFREHWEELAAFFASAPDKLTRRELRALWPIGRGAPSEHTLWRWLKRAVAENLLRCEGTGHRNAPFRYWTAARETEWMNDPMKRFEWEREALNAELERLRTAPLELIAKREPRRKKRTGTDGPAAESGEA
jgi:hypothetical protein